MKSPLTLFAVLLFSFSAFAQTEPDTLGNIYDDLQLKNEGTVYLKNGNTISGFVDYSIYTNALTLTTEKGGRSLTPINVSRFDFFDRKVSKERRFNSYDFDGNPTFFEVVKEYDGFMVIILSTPAEVTTKFGSPKAPAYSSYTYPYGGGGQYTQKAILRTSFNEYTCIRIGDEIYPYLVYKTREVDNLSGRGLLGSRSRTGKNIVDGDLMKKLMGDKFKHVRKFTTDQKLEWNNKDDLLKILDYYSRIR